jgi:hypothetical protein
MASDSEDEIEFKVEKDPSYIFPGGKFHEDLDYIRDCSPEFCHEL